MTVIVTVPSTVFTKTTELALWNIPDPPRVVAAVKMDEEVARSGLDNIFCINYSIIMTQL